jgi:hypothetical protein
MAEIYKNIPIQLGKVYQGQQIIHQFVGRDLRGKNKLITTKTPQKITDEALETLRMHSFRQVAIFVRKCRRTETLKMFQDFLSNYCTCELR